MNQQTPIIEFKGVNKWFGEFHVLRDINLSVARGERIVICGPSGSGKSTLIRCINRLEEHQQGELTVDGTELSDDLKAIEKVRKDVGMVFQQFNLFPHLTATQNVMLGLVKSRGKSKSEARQIAHRWLSRVGLTDKFDAMPSQLSGGQQQRVGIARAVAMEPKVLLLDEITSSLDPELVGEVLAVVKELAVEGRTMLLVTHEMAFAKEVADRVVFTDQGHIVIDAPPTTVFDEQPNDRLRTFLSRFGSLHH